MGTHAGAVFSKFLIIWAVASAAALTLAASASATVFSGSKTDPTGDGPSGKDLTSVEARYDSKLGSMRFVIRLASAPAGSIQITTGLGTRASSGTCSVPLLLLGSFLPDGQTAWLLERNGTTPAEEIGPAKRSISSRTVTLTAKDPKLKGFKPNCAETILSDPADSQTTYDKVSTFKMKPPPPRPRLKVKVGKVGAMLRGTSRQTKVTVANRGNGVARQVVLRMTARGKASVRPKLRRLGKIGAGKSRTVNFRIKAQARGAGKVTLTARVRGKKSSARNSKTFRITRPQPPVKPGTGSLAGKIFWSFESYSYYGSQDPVLLHFTDRRFVRWGFPKGGLKGCNRVTARTNKDGEMQPGCLRYSFKKASGKVRIGKVRGTFRKGRLKLKMDDDVWSTKGDQWYRGLAARPGTRFRTALINRGYYGCGVNPFCTTWKENVTLTRDGRFGRQDSSLSTGGGIGTGLPFVAINRLGPDQRGRYKVLSRSRILFSFANGKKLTETLIVQTNKRGRPDPVREGLLLDDVWFYPDD